MRRISAKKANEYYKAMIIRHCYPYCVILDKEKMSVAFRNRNYLFLQGYPEDKNAFWHTLEPLIYKNLQTFLANNVNVHFQPYGDRFLEYYLYNDGNPPMGKKSDFNLYRKLIEKIISLINNEEIKSALLPEEQGFDYGKHNDGEYLPYVADDPLVNVYDAAIHEADSKYIYREDRIRF